MHPTQASAPGALRQADAEPAFQAAFSRVGAFLQAQLGHTLFTVSHALPGHAEVERIHSSQPALYPVGGRSSVDHTDWTRQMARGECFVANQASEFGPHFHNLQAIVAQGFGAVINIPVHRAGRLLGTLNLLHHEGAYRGDVLPACQQAAALAADAFSLYEQHLDSLKAPDARTD